jgi:hypothetical protein
MADIDLEGVNTERGKGLATASKMTTTDLVRNLTDPVAVDGSRAMGAVEALHAIAANTSLPGLIPTACLIYASAVANTGLELIRCPGPTSRIVILDMFVSINAAVNLAFMNQLGNVVMAPFYGINAGQGFVKNFYRGLWLPLGSSLHYTASAAQQHSLEINYAIL